MHRHLQRASDAIDRMSTHLSDDVLTRRRPGTWSIAEILEHLSLSYERNAKGFGNVTATEQPRATAPTLRQRLGRVLVVDLAYFPRARAPEPTSPTGAVPPAAIRGRARDALAALDRAMEQAEALLGDRRPLLNHPFFAGMSVRQWRKFHWRHTEHHMKQARAILADRAAGA